MRYKCNPMLSLVALVLMALILVFTCTGCTEASAATEQRFTKERHQIGGDYVYIITDNQTGVQYLYFDAYNAGGLTKLEG